MREYRIDLLGISESRWVGAVRATRGMLALGLLPEGKRAVGRPKTTWWRTLEVERTKAGWSNWSMMMMMMIMMMMMTNVLSLTAPKIQASYIKL